MPYNKESYERLDEIFPLPKIRPKLLDVPELKVRP